MATLTLDLTGMSGLAPRYYGDKPYTSSTPNLRYLGETGQFAEGIYNPVASFGYMSPANNTTKTISGTTSYLLTSALVNHNGVSGGTADALFFADEATTGTTGKIMRLDTTVDTSLTQEYEIPLYDTNKYSKCIDMIEYEYAGASDSMRAYFIRYGTTETNNHTVGVAEYNFSTPDPDWMQTVPTGAFTGLGQNGRPFFVMGDNSLLYILAANEIHSINCSSTGGSNGIVSESIVVFPDGTRAVDGMCIRNRMWVGMHMFAQFTVAGATNPLSTQTVATNVGIYIWDKRSVVTSMQDFIIIPNAKVFRSIHQLNGVPVCFTESADGFTQLHMWNGTQMEVVQTLGQNAYPVYRRHSVYEGTGYIMWFGNDGKIYYYGTIEQGTKNALYILGDMSSHVTTNETFSGAGVMVALNGSETVTSGAQAYPLAFYLSYTDTAGNHLKKWYPHSIGSVASNNQVGHIGNVYTLVNHLPALSNARTCVIRCAPTSTGSTEIATIKYYFNQSSTASITKAITMTDASKGYILHDLNKQNVNSVQIEIEFSTSQTLGTDSFRPSFAQIEYDPTNAHTPSGA